MFIRIQFTQPPNDPPYIPHKMKYYCGWCFHKKKAMTLTTSIEKKKPSPYDDMSLIKIFCVFWVYERTDDKQGDYFF